MTDAERRIAELERLVLALADKLATVAEHLSRLAERREFRPQSGEPSGRRVG